MQKGTSRVATARSPLLAACKIFSGRDAVLKIQPRLAELATRTSQTGEADNLDYLTSTPSASKKIPHVIFLNETGPDPLKPTSAIFLFEYKSPLGGARVFAADDGTGRRNIIAPPDQRARVAALATRSLIERGAHVVHLGFCEAYRSDDEDRDHSSGRVVDACPAGRPTAEIIASTFNAPRRPHIAVEAAFREREITSYLPLLGTFEATLARLSRKSRLNLRYFRRRCEAEHGCCFVPFVKPTLTEFLAFNRQSTYGVSDELATWRYHTALAHPNYCVRGVRDRDGRWLSMIGIRRHNSFVEVDWQMNRDDLPSSSLSTVMRSYLIAYEIELGSTRLYMEGGTPKALGNSFLSHTLGELTAIRKSVYVGLLKRFSPHILPPRNYIRVLLADPTLQWNAW